MPTLSFGLETLDDARARFDAAIEAGPYTGAEGETRPGEQRRHTFDFDDGLRLIVSHDRYPTKPPIEGIHVSASLHEGVEWPLSRRIQEAVSNDEFPGVPPGNVATSIIGRAARARFEELSGYTGKFKPRQISPTGVIHYNVPLGVWGAWKREAEQ